MTDSTQIKKIRKRKPLFVRKDSHKKDRVPFKWRKPKGKHSPIRQRYRGKPKMVSIGYGSPEEMRGLHFSGTRMVVVENARQLEALDPKTAGAIISGKVGCKNRIMLIKLAAEKNIKIINFKDAQKKLAALEEGFRQRAESKKKKLTEKEKKEAERKKKAEEKTEKETKKEEGQVQESAAEEQKEKKEQQKEEIEKTIIKKQ